MKKMSLVTMTQGNSLSLIRTIDSMSAICDEFIIGTVCVFEKDIQDIKAYTRHLNAKIVQLPFDFIYQKGFSVTLNVLADAATNDLCVYLNVGEVFQSSESSVLSIINCNNCNYYYIDHETEKHRWGRVWNPSEMFWSGLIHEEVVGDHRPYHRPLFRFADTEKDMNDSFKAAVYNDVKEIVYWNQLIKIVDNPEVLGATSIGWVQFAKDNYQTMKSRLALKGNRPKAFEEGNLKMYLNDVYSNPEFEKERFESNHIIEFQGDPKYLNK